MLLFYMVRYLFYTIGDLTYQSPLVYFSSSKYPDRLWAQTAHIRGEPCALSLGAEQPKH